MESLDVRITLLLAGGVSAAPAVFLVTKLQLTNEKDTCICMYMIASWNKDKA